jgi:hypothetical protein
MSQRQNHRIRFFVDRKPKDAIFAYWHYPYCKELAIAIEGHEIEV